MPDLAPTAKGTTERVELTRPQQAVARRMAESKATAPDLSMSVEAAIAPGPDAPARIVAAVAGALREVPRANGAYRDGGWELYSRVNVGVVMEHDGALLVPVVHDADAMPVEAIATTLQTLAEKVAAGAITQPDLSGATFTIHQLDGVRRLVPVLNPPQAGALGVGDIGPASELTLVCDHRILFGSVAAAFLGAVRRRLR